LSLLTIREGEKCDRLLGGKAGNKAGETIGDYAGFQAEQKALRGEVPPQGHYEYAGVNSVPVWVEPQVIESRLPPEITQTASALPPPQKVELEGQADMNVSVKITDERSEAAVTVSRNDTRVMRFNTGNAFDARDIAP
jgi:hypothetical protein